MARRFQRLALPVIILVCSAVATSQSIDPKLVDGRWNLVIDSPMFRSEALVDIRVEADGTARLVILTRTAGEDGLFTGSITGNKFQLKGEYDRVPVEIALTIEGDRMNGQMTGVNRGAEVQGQRLPVARPEVSVKGYGLLFDAIWNGVKLYFYDQRLHGVDPADVRQRYLQYVKGARNDGEFAVAIRRSLRELRASNTDFFLSAGDQTTSFKKEQVIWKQLEPGVSYLALSNFNINEMNVKRYDTQLDRAMDEVVKYPSLVLDLRGNKGETMEAALLALNFILPEGRPVSYFATRQGLKRLGLPSIDRITPSSLPSAYLDDPVAVSKFPGVGMYLAGGKYKRPYHGRIALLIDESCGGSCELFAAAMKEAGAATLIGRRTRGALFFTSSVSFNFFKMLFVKTGVKGWTMELPLTDVRTAGGVKIEGQGVAPDLEVERDAPSEAFIDCALSWLKGNGVKQTNR